MAIPPETQSLQTQTIVGPPMALSTSQTDKSLQQEEGKPPTVDALQGTTFLATVRGTSDTTVFFDDFPTPAAVATVASASNPVIPDLYSSGWPSDEEDEDIKEQVDEDGTTEGALLPAPFSPP